MGKRTTRTGCNFTLFDSGLCGVSFIKYLYRTDLERNRTRLVSVLLARYIIGKGGVGHFFSI